MCNLNTSSNLKMKASEETEETLEPSESEDVEIDPEKMKGDAIGDTVYSERYVLKVLIQLTQYEDNKWTEEFESDLCVLWDMTASQAVVEFLMTHDCLNLILSLLQSSTNPRMMEILVGILGNMCCVKEVRSVFSEDQGLCEFLPTLLSLPDPQTLTQLMRCFQSFTWDLVRGDATLASEQHWFEKLIVSGEFASQIAFILSSSLCEELLMAVLDLMNTLCGFVLTDKDYSRYFSTTEMLDGMMECWTQLFLSCKEGSKFEFPNKHLEKAALQWVSVLLAFATHETGRELLGQRAKQIVADLLNWIQQPQAESDTLLISTISLLEALVGYYFCQEAFCKTVRIVRKTTEEANKWERDEFTDSAVLSLKESFGNYCMEVLKCVDRPLLDSVLTRCCNDRSIKFFWDTVRELELPDCAPNDNASS